MPSVARPGVAQSRLLAPDITLMLGAARLRMSTIPFKALRKPAGKHLVSPFDVSRPMDQRRMFIAAGQLRASA